MPIDFKTKTWTNVVKPLNATSFTTMFGPFWALSFRWSARSEPMRPARSKVSKPVLGDLETEGWIDS